MLAFLGIHQFLLHIHLCACIWFMECVIIVMIFWQSSMVFYENTGLQNLYDIVRYCQVFSMFLNCISCNRSHQITLCLDTCTWIVKTNSFSSSPKQNAVAGPFSITLLSHRKTTMVHLHGCLLLLIFSL